MSRTRKLLALGLALTVGCAQNRMNTWLGSSDANLLSSWGAPDKETRLSDGGRVLTWSKEWRMAGLSGTCRRSFTISPTGSVTAWAEEGCP